jgi:hypothetical protein
MSATLLALVTSYATTARAETRVDKKAFVTPGELGAIVAAIVAEFDTVDVVCLGEDHGNENDSILRIAVVEHPDFAHKVDVVIVECAAVTRQELLDRFILDGEAMTRDQLRPVWADAHGAEVWEDPIYEAFLRAVQKVNLALPKDERVRVLAGDDPRDSNRATANVAAWASPVSSWTTAAGSGRSSASTTSTRDEKSSRWVTSPP